MRKSLVLSESSLGGLLLLPGQDGLGGGGGGGSTNFGAGGNGGDGEGCGDREVQQPRRPSEAVTYSSFGVLAPISIFTLLWLDFRDHLELKRQSATQPQHPLNLHATLWAADTLEHVRRCLLGPEFQHSRSKNDGFD